MPQGVRRLLHRFVPAQFVDPVGLVFRILRSRDPAAYSAMSRAALQALVWPLDLALGRFERRLYERAAPPRLPIVMVVGAPRSGTTLFAQTVISSLPLAYLNNLAMMFPDAPILINKLVHEPFRNKQIEYKSFYGRTRHWYGPNDSLGLWDRWFGPDRTVVPRRLEAGMPERIQKFFGAFEAAFQRPLMLKNNALNTYAHLVAPVLPTTLFICVRRDPLYLAQSLLLGRREIHGTERVTYGLDAPVAPEQREVDAFESVCRQVAYLRHQESLQLKRLGAGRFWIIEYEDFCRDPGAAVRRVATRVFGEDACDDRHWADLKPFTASARRHLPPHEFERLAQLLAEMVSVS